MLHQQLDWELADREAWALRRQLGIPNNRRLWVLACMDERLPVEHALGLREGDAHVFRNAGGGKLERLAVRGLERSNGWWNRIVAGDFNDDGRVDFVGGNLGLNSRLHASASEPATMYVKDFDSNGFSESVISV